ncbi:hypothetical protein K2173_007125 [Erythroxylum novogranatense]|uniref:AP2/ERF domain-containing protein n=1 Tax=Erythroxylum novogranatense TaxID=1862640 RepID=A0AAV8SYW8_9ROSI|nr:hypothetical protein K2173_007125 [Erythroxylum novogranatense]
MISANNTAQQSSAGMTAHHQQKYKGVRRRKWGKWVSEIRVPGTQERLWLGTYTSPEGAAVAHDVASYCLRGHSSVEALNFPLMLPASVRGDMSPKSIQQAASDAGMAVDARMIRSRSSEQEVVRESESGGMQGIVETEFGEYGKESSEGEGEGLSISVDDYLY